MFQEKPLVSSTFISPLNEVLRHTHQMTVSLWKHHFIFLLILHTNQASADPKTYSFIMRGDWWHLQTLYSTTNVNFIHSIWLKRKNQGRIHGYSGTLCRWGGAVLEKVTRTYGQEQQAKKSQKRQKKSKKGTDRSTDLPTDQLTDRHSGLYGRVPRDLKRERGLSFLSDGSNEGHNIQTINLQIQFNS